MAFLAPETLGFDDGDTLQADVLEGFLHLVELERFDDRFDLFHEKPPFVARLSFFEHNGDTIFRSVPATAPRGEPVAEMPICVAMNWHKKFMHPPLLSDDLRHMFGPRLAGGLRSVRVQRTKA